jgi:phosphatidate cytidylyltransferase
VVVIVAVVPAVAGGWVFAGALAGFGLLGMRELARAFRQAGYTVYSWMGSALLVGILLAAVTERPTPVFLLILTAPLLLPLARSLTSEQLAEAFHSAVTTTFAVLYLALPLGAAGLLRGIEGEAGGRWLQGLATLSGSRETGLGLAWFFWCFSVTWLTDTAAYVIGSRFGRAKLAPRLSPGKTRVGAVAGLGAGAVAGLLAAAIFGVPLPLPLAVPLGLLLSAIAQIGDLAESLLKRAVGVKDMGTLIPGHGGVIDRIDSLLFTLPTTLALATLLAEVP